MLNRGSSSSYTLNKKSLNQPGDSMLTVLHWKVLVQWIKIDSLNKVCPCPILRPLLFLCSQPLLHYTLNSVTGTGHAKLRVWMCSQWKWDSLIIHQDTLLLNTGKKITGTHMKSIGHMPERHFHCVTCSTLWQKSCWINQENPCSRCCTGRYLLNESGRQKLYNSSPWPTDYIGQKEKSSVNKSILVCFNFFLPECKLVHRK